MLLRVISLALFLFFAGFAAAAGIPPPCSNASWQWPQLDNSLGQDPCTVAAYLITTCAGPDTQVMGPLRNGSVYGLAGTVQFGNGCMCNTVMYSLMSACDACQGSEWPAYWQYSAKCLSLSPPGIFPHPVPPGTRVPKWALSPDVAKVGNFDLAIAASIVDTPEAAPTTSIGH